MQQTRNNRRGAERTREFGIVGIFGKYGRVVFWLGLAIAILVDLRDQGLVEEGVALAAYLREVVIVFVPVAGCRIYAGNLGARELRQRDVQDDGVNVKTALAIEWLGRRLSISSEGEIEIENGLNVSIKTVVTLPGEDPVAALQIEDGVRGIGIEVVDFGDTGLCRLIAVIVSIVEFGHAALIVRRNYAGPEQDRPIRIALVEQCHRIGLADVLIVREHAFTFGFDNSKEREDRRGIRKDRLEPEPIGEVGPTLGDIGVESDMDVVNDAVIEEIQVRAYARLLERIDRKSSGQIFFATS